MLDVRRMRVLREVAVRGSFSGAAEALSFTQSAVSQAIAGLRGGRLRMAAFESAGATLMPLAIAAFRERHPAVELSLSLSEPEDCVPLLKSGELDLAIVFESAGAKPGDGI